MALKQSAGQVIERISKPKYSKHMLHGHMWSDAHPQGCIQPYLHMYKTGVLWQMTAQDTQFKHSQVFTKTCPTEFSTVRSQATGQNIIMHPH